MDYSSRIYMLLFFQFPLLYNRKNLSIKDNVSIPNKCTRGVKKSHFARNLEYAFWRQAQSSGGVLWFSRVRVGSIMTSPLNSNQQLCPASCSLARFFTFLHNKIWFPVLYLCYVSISFIQIGGATATRPPVLPFAAELAE